MNRLFEMHESRFELAATWLQTAMGDLHVAEVLLEEMPAASCFHAQQAAEKALKAVLVCLVGDSPRLHTLGGLCAELTALRHFPPADVTEYSKLLDQFYMPTRYPDALGDIDPHSVYSVRQSREAYEAAQAIIDWARREIKDAADRSQ